MARGKAERQKGKDRLPLELREDEVDAFHKAKDKVYLAASDSEEDGDLDDSEPDEEAVYDVPGSDDGSSLEDEEEDDEDSEDGTAENGRGHLSSLAKQEKALRAKIALQRKGEFSSDSEEEEDEDEDQPAKLWGARKRAYYAADEDGDEDANLEEEEEAKRLQREAAQRLRPEDYGIADLGIDAQDDNEQEGLDDEVQVEELGEQGVLTDEQKAAILEDAPELATLLQDLHSSLTEVRTRIGPLVKEVREGGLATAEGVSYLEAKHLLLLHYCLHLLFYLLLKAEGRPVTNHPVIARLVEIRTYLEKIRPLDKRLKYQTDKLLAAAAAVQSQARAAAEDDEADAGDDTTKYGPRPEALVPEDGTLAAAGRAQLDEGAEMGAANGIYRPPRLNPTTMEDDEDPDKDTGKRNRRAQREGARRAARSDVVRSLAAEVAGAPEELRETGGVKADAAEARRVRERLAARAEAEEELMARVPLTKAERQRFKASHRADMAGGVMLDDFADDVAHLVQSAGTSASMSQRFGVNASSRPVPASGDADLPPSQPLHERRARLDSARGRQAAAADDSDDAPETLHTRSAKPSKRAHASSFDDADDAPAEDPFYAQAAEAAKGRKKQKSSKYSAGPTLPPLTEPESEGPRKVSRAVEKNRGLTPHRRRDLKNPRVKGRKRFESATKKRRGQVADVRPSGGGYGGEATGIKSRVSKSTRFSR